MDERELRWQGGLRMTTKKKSPGGNRGGKPKNNARNVKTLSPRLQRLCKSLLSRPRTCRELIDIIPTNNPALYVATLRRQHGLVVPVENVKFTTSDGVKSWYGKYHLTARDKQKAKRLIGAG